MNHEHWNQHAALSAALPCAKRDSRPILLCLSHLRWDFVFQRPQHLMVLAAKFFSVVFFEEPIYGEGSAAKLHTTITPEGIIVATPLLPIGTENLASSSTQQVLLDQLLGALAKPLGICWYYTPMALSFAGHLKPETVVFDCMDELAAFQGAPPQLLLLERRLLESADLVFTGGRSLHNAKRRLRGNVHLFPSSVDVKHFAAARMRESVQPFDQTDVPAPRIGFFGVIDERMDLELVEKVAALRPNWQFMMVGPVVKIDPLNLPRKQNLHWLGIKSYRDLPNYLSGWNAGFMPFALNAATRFISPTKTPEFLAAGIPTISTAIPDVLTDWGDLVTIVAGPDQAVSAIEHALSHPNESWLIQVDKRLQGLSWSKTWESMHKLIRENSATDHQMASHSFKGERQIGL